ncbi:MAG: tripartite tricarboxylate transporter TctB family protein [Sphaerochaetaceae bacterium]|nr:tripartite tricarboxylate transporter TctB family protein [Sphaerochaetaceae bacterium]
MLKLSGNRIYLLVTMAVLLAFATKIPTIPTEARSYPLVLLIGAFIFSLILFFKDTPIEQDPLQIHIVWKIIIFLAMVVIYLFLMTKVGYIIATAMFLYASLLFLRLENKILLITFPLVLTLVLYFLFTRLLSVILPEGAWFGLYL